MTVHSDYLYMEEEWNYAKNADLNPQDVSPGARKIVWWQCAQGHEWQAALRDRKKGSGCPYCSNRKVLAGYNDLATTNPEFTSQWHPTKNGNLKPTDVTERSSQIVWWQCSKGHEWTVSLHNRSRSTGCPVCSGRKPEPGVSDFLTLQPQLSAQWHPTKNSNPPSHYTEKSSAAIWWQCTQGHEWQAPISRRVRGSGCPICAGKQVLLGGNDLATTHPHLALQWHPTKNEDLLPTQLTRGSETLVWWQCVQGHEWRAYVHNRTAIKEATNCPSCSNNGSSAGEESVAHWLESNGLTVKRRTRDVVQNYELDIYLPEYRFAIEFNGLYWHSEAADKTKEYHKQKTDAATRNGIILFHLWEDDWREHKEIIQRMILHRLGLSPEPTIYARQTSMAVLSSSEAHRFLEQNHVQGSAVGSVYLGLKNRGDDEIVAVMVLKKTAPGVYYLERYATSCRVPGGFTKLFKAAIIHTDAIRVVTFADHGLSQGDLYTKTGFTAEKILPPDYSYLVRGRRVHKFNYRLKRFRNDPALCYEEGLSERQLALLNRLPRIWDCGKTRYVWERTT